MPRVKGLLIVGGRALAATAAAVVLVQQAPLEGSTAAVDYEVTTDDYHKFTRDEFAAWAMGKSKAEVRAELGSPGLVLDDGDSDSWFYSEEAIYDPDAGIQVHVWLSFDDATAAVTNVRF